MRLRGHHHPGRGMHAWPPVATTMLVAIGVLAVGALVYVFDRPVGSAAALPPVLTVERATRLFGALGQSLPSFAHAFAFSLLTCLVVARRRAAFAVTCAAWALVDTLFEIGQHPAVSTPLARALHHWSGWPGAEATASYFLRGHFDPFDVLAGSAGAAAALLFAVLVIARETRS